MKKNVKRRVLAELELICGVLGIKTPRLVEVDDLPGTQIGAADRENNSIYIKRGLAFRDALFVVAHECRHMWQESLEGHAPNTGDIAAYNRQETELDAHAFAVKYMVERHGEWPALQWMDEAGREEIYRRAKEMKPPR